MGADPFQILGHVVHQGRPSPLWAKQRTNDLDLRHRPNNTSHYPPSRGDVANLAVPARSLTAGRHWFSPPHFTVSMMSWRHLQLFKNVNCRSQSHLQTGPKPQLREKGKGNLAAVVVEITWFDPSSSCPSPLSELQDLAFGSRSERG